MCGGGSNTVTSQSQPPAAVLNAYQNIVSQAQHQAQQPLQQYTGNLVSGFTPQQQQAFNAIGQAQNVANPYINAAAQYASSAATPISAMGFQGAGNNGQGLSQMGVNYLGQATQGLNVPQWSPQAVAQYQSPYTQQVASATAAQMKNLDAQQNQQVVGNAISSGAWGGDRAAVAQSELANQQSLANNQTMANIYQQGFGQAQQQLNTQQQLALQQGTTQAQLASNAAQQSLGEFNAQQQAGLNAQQATGWLGANAGMQMGALGQEAQGTALTGAQSLLSSGTLQQQLNQEQLNIPYEQFQQQQAWPYQQLGWLAGIDEGTGSQMGGTSSTTSPGPSELSQIMGGIGSAAGIIGMAAMLKRGGRVGRADGGGIDRFDVPDVSDDVNILFAPSGRGMGPPMPPPPMQQQQNQSGGGGMGLGSIMQIAQLAGAAGGGGGFARGGLVESPFDIPDVSMSIIPMGQAGGGGGGHGPPAAPAPMQQGKDSGSSTSQSLSGIAGAINQIQAARALNQTGNNIAMNANAAGIDALGDSAYAYATPMAMTELNPMPFISMMDENRGGRVGYDGGGVAGSLAGPRGIATPQLGQVSSGAMAPSLPGQQGVLTPQLAYQQPSTAPVDTASTSNYAPPPVSQAPSKGYYRPGQGPQAASTGPGQSGNGYTFTYNGKTYTIPNMFVNGSSWALARGGRAGYDSGGTIEQAGAGLSGQPLSLGNPVIQRASSNFGGMSDEQLQELSVRLGANGANSGQGQLVQRALMQHHMHPGQSNTPSAADALSMPPPSMPQSGFGQQPPGFAFGGRAGYDDGGDGDYEPTDLQRQRAAPRLSDIMQITRPIPSVAYEDADVGNLPAPSRMNAVPRMDKVDGTPLATMQAAPMTAPSGLGAGPPPAPQNKSAWNSPRSVGFAPTPEVDTWQPPVHDEDAPDMPQRADSDDDEAPARNATSLANSPWLALIAAGGAMMASKSPHFGQALGEGIEAGVKELTGQGKEQADEDYRKQEIGVRKTEAERSAKMLDETIEQHKSERQHWTEEMANSVRSHQDQLALERDRLSQGWAEFGQRQALTKQDFEEREKDRQAGLVPPAAREAEWMVANGLAPDLQTGFKVARSGYPNANVYNTAVQHELALIQKDPSSLSMTQQQREALAEQNVQERGVARQAGNVTQAAAPSPQAAQPPVAGAKKAPDGNWYIPDPNRPGKYLQVNQ